MKTHNNEKGSDRRLPTLRRRLIVYLAIPAAIILAAIWLTETFFLGTLHRAVKEGEMRKVAAQIAAADAGSLDGAVERLGMKYNLCVSVYDMNKGGRETASWHSTVNPFCFIHGFVSDSLAFDMYDKTGSEGEFTNTVKIGQSFGGKDEEESDAGESILMAKASGGTLVVLNAHLSPLSTTVTTLRIMTAVISAVIVVGVALIAYFLPKKVSGPLVKMREGAGRLASGDYDVRFVRGNTRETAELADALNIATHELSETDRIRRDLIANVSHDLRTPLTLISGYAEVMRDIPGEMNSENMDIIVDETKMLTHLVNDMLDASKLTEGAVKIEPAPFSLTEALSETVSRYSKLKGAEGFDIALVADRDATVAADRTRILQVLYNLLNNAVNYTGDDTKITVRQTVNDSACRVEITDTGDGIPEEDLPLIWDRYFKSREFHKRTKEGTGLGLSIVKNLLMLHGAPFGVISEKGKGSTFWFELPLAESEETL
ncbi:MAG: HAMP domain-containing histidine kinase [Clostridia bacterium]|nr:HAMP domain-containing histidine kinase [Clostridia bacterium]